uniref:Uncharacterized protein n=1 Tax=Arundo donax TaxID=35708 RepID=A0A0A9HDF8_ARUDO
MQSLSIMSLTSFVLVSRTPSRQLQLLPLLMPMAGEMLLLSTRATTMVWASCLPLLITFKMLMRMSFTVLPSPLIPLISALMRSYTSS